MADLLSEVFHCPYCSQNKEFREFAQIADPLDYPFSICKECHATLESLDDIFHFVDENNQLESCQHCKCQDFMAGVGNINAICRRCWKFHKKMTVSKHEKLAEQFEFAHRHGE